MKIYHADLTTEVVLRYQELNPEKKLHALISYGRRDADYRDLMFKYRNKIDSLAMDSGTFSLYSNPKKFKESINFQGYKSHLKLFADKVDFFLISMRTFQDTASKEISQISWTLKEQD